MSQVINTNMASLSAQRALGNSQGDVATALERLSSGLRINSAKDDAAGLAISERFNAQIKGLNQAVRNANDAVSLSQTAESALAETTALLQRARELSVQAANATNSTSDRQALQAEVTQVVAEIDRIASTTEFNGIKLLDGNFTSKQFQVGANANQTVGVSISSAASANLGSVNNVTYAGTEFVVIGAAAATADSARVAETLTFTVTEQGKTAVSTSINVGANEQSSSIAASISANVDGLAANATTGARISYSNTSTTDGSDNFTISINGTSLGQIDVGADVNTTANTIAAAMATKAALAGLTVTTSSNGIDIRDTSGADIQVDVTALTDAAGGSANTLDVTALDADGNTVGSAVNLVASRGTKVSGDITFTTTYETTTSFAVKSTAATTAGSALYDGGSGANNTDEVGTPAASTDKVSTIDIGSVTGAQTAISVLDAAIATVSSQRANLGAIQNRFDSVVSSLQASSENQSGARSRIVDADFAAETAALTRGQILQQAGIAVLAQANAAPQNVLALLQ